MHLPLCWSSYLLVSTRFHVRITTSYSFFLYTCPNNLSLTCSLVFATPARPLDSPLTHHWRAACSARLVSLSSIIEGDGRMLNYLRGPNMLIQYRVILVIHHSLAECIAPDEALALRFLHSHWVAPSPLELPCRAWRIYSHQFCLCYSWSYMSASHLPFYVCTQVTGVLVILASLSRLCSPFLALV